MESWTGSEKERKPQGICLPKEERTPKETDRPCPRCSGRMYQWEKTDPTKKFPLLRLHCTSCKTQLTPAQWREEWQKRWRGEG